ncbi:MAG: hypothetical protein ACYTG2_15960 [Planctomycetota bacterium]
MFLRRLLLVLVVGALTLVVAEGVVSLAKDRSMLHGVRPPKIVMRPAPPASTLIPVEDRPGLYSTHADPRVGYVMHAGAELEIYDGRFETDELGLRRRPAPPRGQDPLHLIVLGDSVAFGYGLADEDTLAHRLETLLNQALPPGARPVECRTVAMPGWNHRNAAHFLLDHMAALDPDIVAYLPIPNDLYDTDGVNEVGRRRMALDPASPDVWLSVNQLAGIRFGINATQTLRERGQEELFSFIGPDVVTSDLTAESQRRYLENVESIRAMKEQLGRRGGRLILLQWQDERYAWHLRRRMLTEEVDVPVVPLYEDVTDDLTLGYDPHPNADAVNVMALWTATDLIRRGWIPGADVAALPTVPAEQEARRAPERDATDVAQRSQKILYGTWHRLNPVLDFETFSGVGQIYGGVNIDGTVGAKALFMLPRQGPELAVRLAPIEGRPDLYPLEVVVRADGAEVGRMTIPPRGEVEARFPVKSYAAPAPPVEIKLAPERYVVTRGENGWQMTSFRPLRLTCLPPD